MCGKLNLVVILPAVRDPPHVLAVVTGKIAHESLFLQSKDEILQAILAPIKVPVVSKINVLCSSQGLEGSLQNFVIGTFRGDTQKLDQGTRGGVLGLGRQIRDIFDPIVDVVRRRCGAFFLHLCALLGPMIVPGVHFADGVTGFDLIEFLIVATCYKAIEVQFIVCISQGSLGFFELLDSFGQPLDAIDLGLLQATARVAGCLAIGRAVHGAIDFFPIVHPREFPLPFL
mmetsp:Transcript_23885/g.66172  ORF Transcript_23885/g.66172 Transcript_23885/m.66172 type:complete len:229 (-) Transcript_23885:375-1061(-)